MTPEADKFAIRDLDQRAGAASGQVKADGSPRAHYAFLQRIVSESDAFSSFYSDDFGAGALPFQQLALQSNCTVARVSLGRKYYYRCCRE